MASDEMNQHKKMAGAARTDNFGVGKFPSREYAHPDIGKFDDKTMDEGARMPAVKGNGRLMQASPDHAIGAGHVDHFDRDGTA